MAASILLSRAVLIDTRRWQRVCVCVFVMQSEEKCVRLQSSLTDAEDKLSSKFPANSSTTTTSDGSAASVTALSQVPVTHTLTLLE